MAFSVKDERVDASVRRYADLKGLTLTKAIGTAVDEALAREGAACPAPTFVERLRELQRLIAAFPVLDLRSADEIIGYDEHGVPG